MTTRRQPPMTAENQSPATNPQSPGSALPRQYLPLVAGYARGPFIEPVEVTPTDWRWRNARSYIVRGKDGLDYRCVRVSSGGAWVGYWAVEIFGTPLSAFPTSTDSGNGYVSNTTPWWAESEPDDAGGDRG